MARIRHNFLWLQGLWGPFAGLVRKGCFNGRLREPGVGTDAEGCLPSTNPGPNFGNLPAAAGNCVPIPWRGGGTAGRVQKSFQNREACCWQTERVTGLEHFRFPC